MRQCLLLALSLLTSGARTPAAEKRRVVLIEDFTQGREAWQPAAVGATDTERTRNGGASLRIADADAARYFTTSRVASVRSDCRYEVTFWCFARDAAHASLCILQREKDGTPATVDGKRQVYWCFPFHGDTKLGQWVQARHVFTTAARTDRVSVILNPADGSPGHTGTAWFSDIVVSYLGRVTPRAEESLPLRPLDPLVLDLGAETCTIVSPRTGPVATAARELADALEAKTGHRPAVVGDTVAPSRLAAGPLLVPGNLVTNAVSRRLYFGGYDFTDCAWPGRGGHVVRTVRDPFGTGAHVLVIGGSSPEDIARAAGRVMEIVGERGRLLGYVNDVRLGKNADVIDAWSRDFLEADAEWKRRGSLGSWQYLWQIGKAGMGYLRTGNDAYLTPFLRELLFFFEHDVLNRQQEAPSQIHSLVDVVLLPWDLLADHPCFSPAERSDVDGKFLRLACSHEGPRSLEGAGRALRGNHGLGRALDGFCLGRYFLRRYGIEEAGHWLGIVDDYFVPQLQSSKPTEDGGYHQYRASLLCTLIYALAADKREYLTGRALREATDRAVLEYAVGKGPMGYLSARAVSAGDPGYLTLAAHAGGEEYVRQCAAMRHGSLLGENLRAFCGFEAPEEKVELLGASVAPLDPMWHERMRQVAAGAGELVLTTTPEESYDKLVIRDGFRPDSFFLKMDGLGHGGHSFQDANCITAYHDHGVAWLFEEYGYSGPTCSTLRQQNGVFAALDGRGLPGAHVCARLLYTRELGDDVECVGGALDGIGDTAWQRHLLRKRDAWTLVVDRVRAKRAGELFVERHWHLRPWGKPGDVEVRGDVVVCRREEVAMHLHSVGLAPEGVSGGSNRKEVVRARAGANAHVDIASLIWVDESPEHARFTLERTTAGWCVRDTENDSRLDVAVDPDGCTLVTDVPSGVPAPALEYLPLAPPAATFQLPWRRIEVGGEVTAVAASRDRIAAGTREGDIEVLSHDGASLWRARAGALVLSLHFTEGELLVGEDDGTLSRFSASGRRLWAVTIPYVHIGWPHWSDGRSRVREITAADMDSDGSREILVSNGDRRLYAFSATGEQLWKKGVRWGVLVGLTPTVYEGQFALFGGVTGPTLGGRVKIHGREGNTVGSLRIPYQHSQQVRDVRLADVTGDGASEIVVARDTSSHQLVVCDEARELLWKADVGGSADALAIRLREGATQILCGSRCGYVHAFEGAGGRREWFCFLGDEPRMLWPREDGSVLALCPSGTVFVLGADGRLLGRQVLPAPITALLRPGEHRVRPACLPVGTAAGALYVLGSGGH